MEKYSESEILKRVKNLRKKNKKTQEEVGKLLGITKQAYYRYEKGRRKLSIETLNILANYYGVTVDYFLGDYFYNDSYTHKDLIKLSNYLYSLLGKYYFYQKVISQGYERQSISIEGKKIIDKDFFDKEIATAKKESEVLQKEIKRISKVMISEIEILNKEDLSL